MPARRPGEDHESPPTRSGEQRSITPPPSMVCRKRSEHARLQPIDKDGKFCSASPSLGRRVKRSARDEACRTSPSSGGVGRTGSRKSESESDGNSDAVAIPVVVLDDSDSGDDRDSDLQENVNFCAYTVRKELHLV
ncbi:hypothetical protein PVAP13_7KG032729 [Panicum virgatum]|uniref:Uncharacterized protein n=1 Tax=Panicum virgatum TaxID=38727 RepID=A0A8T0Q7Q6_PANVG|nr:hypothetical protein PVAP13_7KG032729 [Panicum virgatum]